MRPKLSTPNFFEVQPNLYYLRLYYPRTSIIRGFQPKSLLIPSTADNRGLTIVNTLMQAQQLLFNEVMLLLFYILKLQCPRNLCNDVKQFGGDSVRHSVHRTVYNAHVNDHICIL